MIPNLGIEINHNAQIKILISIIVIIALWVIKWAIVRAVFEKTTSIKVRYQWRKGINYIIFFLGVIILIFIWAQGFGSTATFLGLLSAGIAVALKDPIVNLAGWIFIISRKPFIVGDRIEIGNVKGDVIDSAVFEFSLMEIGNWVGADQSTGRIIHVPNGKVFTDLIGNYTKGFEYIWNEIPVLITFESNWEKAKKILKEVVNKNAEEVSTSAERKIKETARRFMIFYKTLTPTVYTSVKESGVLLTIRYMCDARKRRGSEQVMWEAILKEFSKHKDIDLAYPTERRYNHLVEGKMRKKIKR